MNKQRKIEKSYFVFIFRLKNTRSIEILERNEGRWSEEV